jgi:hypothetical protein
MVSSGRRRNCFTYVYRTAFPQRKASSYLVQVTRQLLTQGVVRGPSFQANCHVTRHAMLCRTITGRFTANEDLVHLPQQPSGTPPLTSGPHANDLKSNMIFLSIQMDGQARDVAVGFSLSNIMTDLLLRLETSFLASRQHELRCRKRTAAACSVRSPVGMSAFPSRNTRSRFVVWDPYIYQQAIIGNSSANEWTYGTLQVEVSDDQDKPSRTL